MYVFESRRVWSAARMPWWQRLLMVFAIGLMLAVSLVVMTLILIWSFVMLVLATLTSALSSLLPSSWRRTTRDQPESSLPVERSGCPWCSAMIETGPVLDGTQQGMCSNCGRNMERQSLGGHWSPWQAIEATERRLPS